MVLLHNKKSSLEVYCRKYKALKRLQVSLFIKNKMVELVGVCPMPDITLIGTPYKDLTLLQLLSVFKQKVPALLLLC